jgi:hypothetical protein
VDWTLLRLLRPHSYSFSFNCTDPLAAAPPHTIVGEKFDFDLGTIDSRGAPYVIRINRYIVQCEIAISLQSFPMAQTSYCFVMPLEVVEAPVRQCSKEQTLTPIGDCVDNWTPPPKTQ